MKLKAASLHSIFSAMGLLLSTIGVLFLFPNDAHAILFNYSDGNRIAIFTCDILYLLEGNFGALVAVVSGLVAIMSASQGNYKLAGGVLGVALFAFLTRSAVLMFFDADLSNCSDLTLQEIQSGVKPESNRSGNANGGGEDGEGGEGDAENSSGRSAAGLDRADSFWNQLDARSETTTNPAAHNSARSRNSQTAERNISQASQEPRSAAPSKHDTTTSFRTESPSRISQDRAHSALKRQVLALDAPIAGNSSVVNETNHKDQLIIDIARARGTGLDCELSLDVSPVSCVPPSGSVSVTARISSPTGQNCWPCTIGIQSAELGYNSGTVDSLIQSDVVAVPDGIASGPIRFIATAHNCGPTTPELPTQNRSLSICGG